MIRRAKIRPGGWGWIGIAVYVCIVDAALILKGHKTMSRVFGCALEHPIRRWPVLVAWAFLTLHLHKQVLPTWMGRFDPFYFLYCKAESIWYAATNEHLAGSIGEGEGVDPCR